MNIGKVQKQVILFLAGFVLGVLYIYMIGCRETDFLGIQSLMQISFLEIGYREYFLYLLKKRPAGDRYCVDRYDSRRSAASCRYCDVFWNEYWWYAVCHDPAIWLERNFAEPELLSAAGSVLYPAGSMGISLLAVRGGQKSDRMPGYHMGEKKKNRLKQIFLVLGVTIIGILAECYVNPMLVKTVLKIF